ncbi:type II CAAX endopeptidase family protein [Alkalithermobacter paradoxus]|uniref:CAAX amino terminal protease self-immunity n=1 Tax=Alkalithermobacter paradoxus TaxID=29349 RepID=A0A1V4I928_9FIRM|nr:CAAX amino terminal protease self- immunity [[Clostridium] thermoalcaliphilum]
MRKITISNIIYLFLAVLFLTVGAYFQRMDINTGLLITEYGIILIPAILFSLWLKKEQSIKTFLRFNKINTKTFIISIFIPAFSYPIAVFGNVVFMFILNSIGIYDSHYIPLASNLSEYLWFLILIGVTPGICEEVLFRGFFLRMNEEKGFRYSIIYSSFLFALFHFNAFNFMGPFVLGIIFAYITIKTNSIYPAIIGHIINNSIATTLSYVLFRGVEDIGPVDIPPQVALAQMAFWGIVSIVSFIILRFLIGMMESNVENENKDEEKMNWKAYIPVIACIVIYVYFSIQI